MDDCEQLAGYYAGPVWIVSSLLVITLVLFALAGYEWRRARLTSKLPGVTIHAGCR